MTVTPFAGFIQPDPSLRARPFGDLHMLLDIPILSGHRADLAQFSFSDPAFRSLVSAIKVQDGFEDQCTAKYYYDMFSIATDTIDQVDRLVEVGVYMGGATVILAGVIANTQQELVLIDINERCLLFSYERMIRSFPSVADRVRLFHGDLPTYVRDVLLPEQTAKRILVQLDGSHAFQEVIRDLGTLSFVQDRLHGIMAQDTHLRGMPQGARFIDAALFGVFGGEFEYLAIGSVYNQFQEELLKPNRYGGNYFLAGKPEGMYLPMSHNRFEYPHPDIAIDDFFW
jgi:hypothetical protein